MKRGIALVFLILMLIFVKSASASLGISPAKIEFNFIPGFEHTFDYTVTSDSTNREIQLYSEGDLARYVTLSKSKIKGSDNFKVSISLPDEVPKPGEHTIIIGAREAPPENEFLGAAIDIRSVIKIYVPYPGRYAEIEFEIDNINEGENLPVNLKVVNRGRENLTIDSKIDFFSDSNLVDTLNFKNERIVVGEEKVLHGEMTSENFPAGEYLAIATVSYGEDFLQANESFRVGSLSVDIINFTRIIEKGENIQKFFVDIESKWNSDINSVFADINITNGINESSFRTPPVDLKAWEFKRIESFFEASTLEPGAYNLTILLKYESKESSIQDKLRVIDNSLNLTYIALAFVLLAIVIVLVLLKKYRGAKVRR